MSKRTFRIFSKAGLLIVLFGFFMPVACNLNGFQLALYSSSITAARGSVNILGIGLWGIFLFSCLGSILLLLIAFRIKFSLNWDWTAITGTIMSSIVVFVSLNGGKNGWGGNIFQSGAYIMFIGMIASLIFMLLGYRVQSKNVPSAPNIPVSSPPAGKVKLFCSQCGNKLQPGYSFCSKCGSKI